MDEARDLAALDIGDFAPHLGETFSIALAEGALPLRLAEATESGPGARSGGAFSLLFEGPPGDYLPQAVYPLDHPALGRLDLFLVPLGPDARGHRYQAVFT